MALASLDVLWEPKWILILEVTTLHHFFHDAIDRAMQIRSGGLFTQFLKVSGPELNILVDDILCSRLICL